MQGKKIPDLTRQEIIRLHGSGMDRPAISIATGVGMASVGRALRSAGLTRPAARLPFNEDFFFRWSDDLAWLLGLIWTDGNLKKDRNAISIVLKDKETIETIARLISMDYGIRKKQGGKYWGITFSSASVTDRLRVMGLHPNKSFTIRWPTGLPHGNEAAFVRGVIDGDGSVLIKKMRAAQRAPDLLVSVCGGSEPFVASVHQWLLDRGMKANWGTPRPTLWKTTITHIASLRTLHGILYPDDSVPAMARKRLAYDAWMAAPRFRGKARLPANIECPVCGASFPRNNPTRRRLCSPACISIFRSKMRADLHKKRKNQV